MNRLSREIITSKLVKAELTIPRVCRLATRGHEERNHEFALTSEKQAYGQNALQYPVER